MSGKPFLDTNVLVYAFTRSDRTELADQLLQQGGIISVQVLNEFVSVLRRKLRFAWTDVEGALEVVRGLLEPPRPVTDELHRVALALAREHHFSIYDGLIVAAAHSANCSVLWTEDMQNGRQIGSVTIRNPFLS